ncbi:dehydratase [Amycolatopsis sp. K13G38]|uniref:Dehydratase n=1 Tax=Amycolatopsis acididurans TaxID=2724524 RepID=A0ABX1JHI4_9PSEU|nr:dehydratase [Amycolatopsis acididurans]
MGQRFHSGTREVTDQDLKAFTELSGDRHPLHTRGAGRFGRPVLHGPFGLAVFLGLLHEMGIVAESVVALLDTRWRYRAPIHVGDTLRFELTVTRCRRTSKSDEGVVNRHVTLLNQDGVTVQEGTTAMLVRARDAGPDPVGRA